MRDDDDVKATHEIPASVDVAVLGSGAAGMAAALGARSQGGSVLLVEKAPTVGGTTAVSGGLTWVPVHGKAPEANLTESDALEYLRAQALESMDESLVEVYVHTAAAVIERLETLSGVEFAVADGFPDYKPELPGGRPRGGRSIGPIPFDGRRLGEWSGRITAFPADWSNVGFDAETRARIKTTHGVPEDDALFGGTALIAGLLEGVLSAGVTVLTGARGTELLVDDHVVSGVQIERGGVTTDVHAGAVIIATGGFEWDEDLTRAFLRGPLRGAASPPLGTGDGLRMAMAVGAELGNMGEAWWVPIVQMPGDFIDGKRRSRSIRLERTRPRCIMVNRAGKRFANEAGNYNSMAGAFHYLDPAGGYVNDPAWMVFDAKHLAAYGFLGIEPGTTAPEWFMESPDLRALAERIGVDAGGLISTVTLWNDDVAGGVDSEFGRGASAYDAWWGDANASSRAEATLGPLDQGPYYAVAVLIGTLGTKGGPRVDKDGRVQHVLGGSIRGLFAAGNAMSGLMGKAYPGAGATIGPALVWGFRAGVAAATGDSFDGAR